MKKTFILTFAIVLLFCTAIWGTGCSKEKHKKSRSVFSNNSIASENAGYEEHEFIYLTDTENYHDFKVLKSTSLKKKQYDKSHGPRRSQDNPLVYLNSDSVNNPPMPQQFDYAGVPVLMYHSISYEPGNDLRVPKEKFQEQMKFLKDNGYSTLTMAQAYEVIHNRAEVPKKSVVITFDDGYVDNYNDAFPILKNFDFTCTIFIITSTVDKDPGYVTSSQIKEMSDYGIDIESHTVNHIELNSMTYEAQLKELTTSKAFLEELLNKKISAIAYPFGKYNSYTERAAKEAGYLLAFTTKYGFAKDKDGMLTLTRVRISALDSLQAFASKISRKD